MTTTLQICLITPEEIVWNETVNEVILPTTAGQMGVLPGHAPVITGLDIGLLKVRVGATESRFIVDGGFGLVKEKNQLILLANQAERYDASSPDFNVAMLEQSLEDKQKEYQNASTSKEKMESLFALKRLQAKYAATQ